MIEIEGIDPASLPDDPEVALQLLALEVGEIVMDIRNAKIALEEHGDADFAALRTAAEWANAMIRRDNLQGVVKRLERDSAAARAKYMAQRARMGLDG